MRYLQVTYMLAFMGSKHGECPHDGKRVLQLAIEEVAYRCPERIRRRSNNSDCSLRLHEGLLNDFCAGDNIPRRDGAVVIKP